MFDPKNLTMAPQTIKPDYKRNYHYEYDYYYEDKDWDFEDPIYS